MRTTIDIPDAVDRRIKNRAACEGRSVNALILEAVERVLNASPVAARRRVKLPLVKSGHPGALRIDSTRIYDVISFP